MGDQRHFDQEDSWCVELLTEWGAEDTGPRRRTQLLWDTESSFGDRDEMRELKVAIARLKAEHTDEHQAIVAEFKGRRVFSSHHTPADRAVLNAAITRLAGWVDEAFDEGE